jgi:titin
VGIRGVPGPGGDVTANVIGPNSSAGILLEGGQLKISANSIAGNGGLGIDLAPLGVNVNDPGDGDTGPNGGQNYPVLSSARTIGGATTVTGAFNSRPNQSYVIELFASPSADPSGHGEGATFIGQLTVVTDAAGNASLSAAIPTAVPIGQVITATATDGQGNTSEFSNAVVVTN